MSESATCDEEAAEGTSGKVTGVTGPYRERVSRFGARDERKGAIKREEREARGGMLAGSKLAAAILHVERISERNTDKPRDATLSRQFFHFSP